MLPDWLKFEVREKWEHARGHLGLRGLRDRINDHPRLVTSVAGVSGALLLIVVVGQFIGGAAPKPETFAKEWYYDLNTSELFTAPKGQEPPIDAPSGPLPGGEAAGVRAYVLSYAIEPSAAERFIGFLETTAPAEMRAGGPSARTSDAVKKWGQGKLIRRVEEEQWVPADSAAGQEIFEEAFAPNSNGERPLYCRPE